MTVQELITQLQIQLSKNGHEDMPVFIMPSNTLSPCELMSITNDEDYYSDFHWNGIKRPCVLLDIYELEGFT